METKMRELFRALEEKKRLLTMLDRFLEHPDGELAVQVGLGEAHPAMDELCQTVEAACYILPQEVAIQIPPNLVDPLPLLSCGASDLGGISPVTSDGISPERPWPREEELQEKLKGYCPRERLPVYPRFISLNWHGSRTHSLVASLAGRDGLRAKKYIF